MNTKKIPYNILVGSLTFGASLILGFLSFTGAMALWPIVPVASIFFGLSVAYEGEIYLQNIKGALNKLGFKENFMHRKLARQYLAEHAPRNPEKDDPTFFHDYINLLKLQEQYKKAGRLNRKDKKRKKAINKAIKKMDKWFSILLFEQKKPGNEVEQELVRWMQSNNQQEWLSKAKQHQYYYYLSAIFASSAGISMGFGTTYLLLGALASMPVIFAASPLLLTIGIVVASLVAGLSYGLLTFNTITDIIDNNTVQNWLKKLKHNLFEKPSVRSVLTSSVALVLFTLALALTICTAGTWWTVIKQTPPLFRWMAKIPSSILMTLPFINGGAALSFNFQNTSESFEMVDDLIHQPPKQSLTQKLRDAWRHLLKNETFWQRLNPFRIALKLTFTPLRIIFFLGHLVSIALTSDRLPGVPHICSFLVGLICEGFEDAHYFLELSEHEHHHSSNDHILQDHLNKDAGHSHNNDLPTRLLNLLFTPMVYLASFWDYKFSKNPNWQKACRKFGLNQDDIENEHADDVKIKSSNYLSKMGMLALKKHIGSSLQTMENKTVKKQCDLLNAKLGFFDDLNLPQITNENHKSKIGKGL